MQIIAALLLMMAALVLMTGAVRLWRWRRRRSAVRLPEETAVLREARDLPVRIFVDRTIAGGPKAGGMTRGRGHLVLTADRFILATGHGRLLDLTARAPGIARCTGPRRLVVEGVHPSGRAQVRAEILVDDAEGWVRAAAHLTKEAAIPKGLAGAVPSS